MRQLVVAFLFGAVFSPAAVFAQSESHIAAAKRLDTLMTSDEVVEGMHQQLVAHMRRVMGESGDTPAEKEIHQKYDQKVIDLMLESLSPEKLSAMQVKLFVKVYTEQEIEELIVFYDSPTGRKFLAKQPEITGEVMQLTQSLLEGVMPKIMILSKEKAAALLLVRELENQ